MRSVTELPTALRFDYELEHEDRCAERSLRVVLRRPTRGARFEAGRLAFDIDLAPRAEWSALLRYESPRGRRVAWRRRPGERAPATASAAPGDVSVPCVEAPDAVRVPFERAANDLHDLRNFELEQRLLGTTDGSSWVVNAGVPMFTGLFGRDVITAGWQSAMLGTRALRGALDAVAATAATEDDPWRDAEPGKLIHELRGGPAGRCRVDPARRLLRLADDAGDVRPRPQRAVALDRRRRRLLRRHRDDGAARRSSGPSVTAISTGMGSSSTNAARRRSPQPGLEGFRRGDPTRGREPGSRARSRPSRSRPSSSWRSSGWRRSTWRSTRTRRPRRFLATADASGARWHDALLDAR